MKSIILLLCLSVACCDVQTKQADPQPNIISQPDINYCKAGCEHLQSLVGPDKKDGCLEARTIQEPDGGKTTCEEFCTITEKNGRALDPKCWTTLQSCDEIEACRKDN
jgi:hypothetical protein